MTDSNDKRAAGAASVASHTPGPWLAVGERGYDGQEWAVYANDAPSGSKLIAGVYGPAKEANAKLIAAAPDIADALAGLVGRMRSAEAIVRGRAALVAAGWIATDAPKAPEKIP